MDKAPYMNAGDLMPVKQILSDELSSQDSVAQVFAEQGIPMDIVGNNDIHIPFSKICGMYEEAARHLEKPQFGVISGASWGLDFIGPYAEFGTAAPNLKECLERLSSAIHKYESGSTVLLSKDADLAKLSYIYGTGNPVGSNHYSDALIGLIMAILRYYKGADWSPILIESNNSKTSKTSHLEDYYQVPVVYGQPALSLVFPASDLYTKNPHSVSVIDQYTLRDLDKLIRSQPPTTMTAVVSETVHIRLLGGLVDIEGAARHLKMGVRSLQRKLAVEGVNYREILARERYCRAFALVSQTDNSITEISRSLGYEYVSDFTRAFIRIHGTAPSFIRRSRSTKNLN